MKQSDADQMLQNEIMAKERILSRKDIFMTHNVQVD
jgi:hypothetical protein